MSNILRWKKMRNILSIIWDEYNNIDEWSIDCYTTWHISNLDQGSAITSIIYVWWISAWTQGIQWSSFLNSTNNMPSTCFSWSRLPVYNKYTRTFQKVWLDLILHSNDHKIPALNLGQIGHLSIKWSGKRISGSRVMLKNECHVYKLKGLHPPQRHSSASSWKEMTILEGGEYKRSPPYSKYPYNKT